jgi:hypothetical protein
LSFGGFPIEKSPFRKARLFSVSFNYIPVMRGLNRYEPEHGRAVVSGTDAVGVVGPTPGGVRR